MDTALNIFLIILLIAASVLCIYLVITLKQVTKTIAALQKDVEQIKGNVEPILANVNIITGKVALVTEEVESVISAVKLLIENLKDKAEDLLDKTKRIRASVGDSPGGDVFRKIVGISRGISAFWSTLKNK
ncbi:MAG TPA: DUF948 domain-containing protein [Ignavibacteriales bacterium]|nr:DUF948 domain-containing protein [Ignavibacteriales bacterium]